MFCPKCKSLMYLKEGKLICRKCGTEKELEKLPVVKEFPKEKVLRIIEGEDALPKTKVECPICSHSEAYWTIRQMRGSDEPETKFYRCTQCGYRWREE